MRTIWKTTLLSMAATAALAHPAEAQSPPYAGQNSAAINGASLGADVQKSNAARTQHVEAFKQALAGFPRDAVTITVTNIAPLAGDPTAINVQYKLGLSPQWLAKLRAGLSALAVMRYRGVDHPEGVGSSYDRPFNQIVLSGRAGNQWGARFCIYGGGASDCYLLPDGDYGQATLLKATGLGISTPVPGVTVRLFAVDGTPTSKCLARVLDHRPNVINVTGTGQIFAKNYGVTGWSSLNAHAEFFLGTDFVLGTDETNGAILVTTKEADFSRSTRMEFRPFLMGIGTPGQPLVLANDAMGRPNSYAIGDITATPTVSDVCAL